MKTFTIIFYILTAIPLVCSANAYDKDDHIISDPDYVKYVPQLSCIGRNAKGNLVKGSLEQYFINYQPHSSHELVPSLGRV